MTSRIKDNVGLAPADQPLAADYARDFYSWLMEQARHVRDGRWDAVDRDNLAEEIESLGREQFNKLESALRVLLIHILKWDHQPKRHTKSWIITIKDQRIEFEQVLQDNPGLKSRLDEALTRAYRRARLQAAKETGLDEDVFPATCPYNWNEIFAREFSI